MDAELFKKAKEIFLEARTISESSREKFIDDHCSKNQELKQQVLALLANDTDETILSRDKKFLDKAIIDPLGLNKVKAEAKPSALSKVLFSSRGRSGLAFLLLALIIAIIGYVAAQKTRQYLIEIRGNETQTILKSNVEALNFWIKEYQQSTQMAISDREIIIDIQKLLTDRNNSSLQMQIDSLLSPYLGSRASEYIITDLSGEIIASPHNRFIGTRINSRFGKEVYAVAGGNAQFILPFYPDTNQSANQTTPLVWMQIPVKNKLGDVIATFGIGREADEDFTRILRTARNGNTAETYAINTQGAFISESRYEDDLRKNGRLPADTNVSSILNLHARDAHVVSETGIPTLTELAVQVVACSQTKSEVQSGVIKEPTIDYRGVEVIGAWRWLPEYGFGVISQVDAAEALAPARYLYIVIIVSVILLLIAASFSFYNAIELQKVKGTLHSVAEVGQYQLSRIIQAGGMGTVYYAHHKLLKRPTAIKVVRIDKSDDNLTDRFEREVKLASQLTHPNTIEIYDYGFTGESQAYYAMEYLNGLNLAEVVKASGNVPPGRVIHIIKQICGSLQEAHTLGLVHRDIKPQNIMLVNKIGLPDFVKVLDFGLAKPFVQESDMEETRAITGTPVYIAPERLKRPGLAEPSSDIYSVGALMYYLLSSMPIFSFSSDLDMLYRILNDAPDPLPAEVPEQLARLTMFCLEKEPDQRPSSIEEVKLFLENLADEFPWTDAEAQLWWKKFGQ